MRGMFPPVGHASGSISPRASPPLPLDLPADFDRTSAIAEFDVQSRVRYQSVDGKKIVRPTLSRPLSWRVHGEECLVADHSKAATPAQPGSYTLFSVE